MSAGKCRVCEGNSTVRNGSVKGKSKIKCKACGFQSVLQEGEQRVYANFQPCPTWKRPAAVLLYSCGLSLSITSRILKVGATTVQRWVKMFARDFIVSAPPGDAVIVEIDEMWHYLKKSPINSGSGKPIIEIKENSSTGSLALVITVPLNASSNAWTNGISG